MIQRAKKLVSDSTGLVDFATGLVNSVLNLPDGQVKFFGEFILQKNCNQSCSSKKFFRLVKVTLGLIHSSYSLPEWHFGKHLFCKTKTDYACKTSCTTFHDW